MGSNLNDAQIEVIQDEYMEIQEDNTEERRIPISQKDLRSRITHLNTEQQLILNKIRNKLLNNDNNQTFEIIHGPGGVGKSYLAKIITDAINLSYDSDLYNLKRHIMVAAPTGVAAKAITGRTLHNAFSLPIEKFGLGNYKPLTGRYKENCINYQYMILKIIKGISLENKRALFKDVKWVIIDEMSMISYPVLRMIHCRLQQFKNNDDLLFGGCNVILMGDLLQLKPIYGGCIFEQPWAIRHEINIWKQFKMNILFRNQRNTGDIEYGELCSRIRVGKQTSNDIKTLIERKNYYTRNKKEFENAIRLCSTKKAVEQYNNNALYKIGQNNKIYDIKSNDTYAIGANCGKNALQKHIYSEESNCGGITDKIKICIGARVMLRRNIDVSIGLVNGAMGTVIGFQWPNLALSQLNNGDIPEFILIDFDDKTIVQKYHEKVDNYVKIRPITVTFDGKE